MQASDVIGTTYRLLRGGSGGGGGGGGSGGSYSGSSGSGGTLFWGSGTHNSGTNNYNSNRDCYEDDINCNDNNDNAPALIGLFFAIIISGICCCCFCFYCIRKKNENFANQTKPGSDEGFDAAVSEARRGIAYKPSGTVENTVQFQTYSATFDTKYIDRNKTLTGVLNISLLNDGSSGYSIDGNGCDADGETKFTDGFVTYNGNAWWLEETCSGPDVGLKVLSQGQFNFENNTFTGTWRSNSKCNGSYVSFVGRNVESTSFATTSGNGGALDQGIPVVQATTDDDMDIPVAFAQEETPVVAATPEPSAPYIVGS